MARWITQLSASFLSLFLQPICPLCDRAAPEIVCASCRRQLQRCCLNNPRQFWHGKLPVLAWGSYDGILKRAITQLKYQGQSQLAQPLGHWLGETWMSFPAAQRWPSVTVVPIPLHSRRLQERGYNQAELIARSFCQYTKLPLKAQGLERCKETQAMYVLKAAARAQNLADAFELGQDFQRRRPRSPVLLVDDIYTTGATVRSAAKTLRQQGIAVLGVAVTAIASPRS